MKEKRDRVPVLASMVYDAVKIGDVLVIRPLLEQVSEVDHIRSFNRGNKDPLLGRFIPDFKARILVLQ